MYETVKREKDDEALALFMPRLNHVFFWPHLKGSKVNLALMSVCDI